MIRTKGLPRSVALFSSLFLIVSLAVAKDAGQTTTTPPRLVTLEITDAAHLHERRG